MRTRSEEKNYCVKRFKSVLFSCNYPKLTYEVDCVSFESNKKNVCVIESARNKPGLIEDANEKIRTFG